MLVNKTNKLDNDYVPRDLVVTDSLYKDNIYLNKECYDNFKKMQSDANFLGYRIDIMSGYRDYKYQEKLYNKLVYEKGNSYASIRIASPGTSEHQTGLMIITDDGEFAHYLLTPRNHIKKMYRVVIDKDITEEMVKGFREGVKLNDGECKMALLEKIDNRSCYVTLTEGRYHQIKRMFGCYGTKVLELERVRMGELDLPKDLERGECRLLKDYERELLQK